MVRIPRPPSRKATGLQAPVSPATRAGIAKIELPTALFTTDAVRSDRPIARTRRGRPGPAAGSGGASGGFTSRAPLGSSHRHAPWPAAGGNAPLDPAGGGVDHGDVVGGAVRRVERLSVRAHPDPPRARPHVLDEAHDLAAAHVDHGYGLV